MFLINKMNSTPLLLWALLNTTKLVVARFPLLSHKSHKFSLEAIALRLSRFFVIFLKMFLSFLLFCFKEKKHVAASRCFDGRATKEWHLYGNKVDECGTISKKLIAVE